MNERLKGRTILIGKEEGQGRLMVSVSGVSKPGIIGSIGSVPGSVSRLKNGTAHCQLTIGQDGIMTIKNLKEPNVTYVNGAAIVSKRIDEGCRVELGKDRYAININEILQAALRLLPASTPPPPPTVEYSIKHLERVWTDYTEGVKQIAIRQRNTNLLSSVPMAFSMLGGLVTGVAPEEVRSYALAFTGIAFLIMIYGIYRKYTDKSIEEKEQLVEKFQKDYVCPNPKCHHYLEGRKYSLLLQDGQCKYCKCKLVE